MGVPFYINNHPRTIESMKNLFFVVFAIFASLPLFSQTTNYALENADGTGSILASGIRELNHSSEATFQLWIKPTTLKAGAELIAQDNLSVGVNSDYTLYVKSGTQKADINYRLSANNWVQLTLVLSQGNLRAFVNNAEQAVSGSLPAALSEVTTNLTLGNGFIGQIDEIRIWKRALDQKDFYWRNTLNKFNPNIDALVAYWKGDQEQCENLVDYQFKHHGIINGMKRVAVTDNASFRYRVATGYTNLMRFIDRPNINKDMFLMTNDLILLSAKVQSDGSIFPEYPDNSAVPQNVNYLADFEGHKGVMDFTGTGSQMVAEDGRTLFDPTTSKGYGEPLGASLQGWIYLDTWKEGATIFSKFQNTDSCLTVKLGSEADKSIVVNFCGTVATLANKLTTGKWQYLGVYLRPKVADITNVRASYNIITIGVDYTEYNAISDIKLSGKNMTIQHVPLMSASPIVIGKDFDGKMDEIMFWGSLRNGVAKSDAENGYQWNVGNWNNIFLCSYWKGDDPDNIGKDYQSYTGMIDFVRKYYANHRGYKIRLGLIYADGDKWKSVLNNKANVDRLVADCQKILKNCDGLDVDLEWSYSASDYAIYNNVVSRLSNEVMKGQNKTFTCSLHEVSYSMDKNLFSNIDYFTFQLYGPQTVTYQYPWYENAYNKFISYGFPKDKILLSYGVLLVNGSTEMGYKDLFEQMGMNDANYNPDTNIWNGWYFNGVNQVKKKQEFIINKDVLGTMYFDMGNDLNVSSDKSLIRAQNEVIAANVDTLITKVDLDITPIAVTHADKNDFVTINSNNGNEEIVICLKEEQENEPVVCQIYDRAGVLLKEFKLDQKKTILHSQEFGKGLYLIKVSSLSFISTKKVQLI